MIQKATHASAGLAARKRSSGPKRAAGNIKHAAKGAVIPPLSVVRLLRSDKNTPQWKHQIGQTFRIGYYSRQDGVNCVWLVNEAGEYEQTIDQSAIAAYFEIIELSKEKASFGQNREPIPALIN